ncbi:hypothetical protein HYZ41_01750 [archaeon]|nr:hypothetical protein [archaeon]
MLLAINPITSFAEQLDVFTDSSVYTDGEPLFVYGNALSNENLIVRLFAPDGTIAKFEQIITESDGSFNIVLLTWPQSSTNFPYGTYTVEIISTVQNGLSKTIDVKFSSTSETVAVPLVLSQDISGVSEQIIKLNSILDETSQELDRLKTEIEGFGSTLKRASDNVDASVSSISQSVTNIEEASVQLNSLLFPIVASIAIIVALQIVIIARRR